MKPLANRCVLVVATALLMLTLVPALMKAQPARAAGCANEAIRVAQGTAALALPDCRAYELVTPGTRPYITIGGGVVGALASTTGGGLAFRTRYPAQDAVISSEPYLALRGASSWSVESVAPQDAPGSSVLVNCAQGVTFSADLSKNILNDGWNPELDGGVGQCGESEETLVPGAPRGYGNLFLREGGTGTPYRLINVTPSGVTPGNALLRGYSPDFTHIVFEDSARLTDDAPSGNALYEWNAGIIHLVSVLPSGEPVSGRLADQSDGTSFASLAPINHAVSGDGEEVFFYADGGLYLRKNATQPPSASGACTAVEPNLACTVQVDQKQGGVGDSGGGTFFDATADGSRAFFSDASQLTADSEANPTRGEADLYELNTKSGLLRDLTHASGVEHPNVGGPSGFSEDGSKLYFVAQGALIGSGANAAGDVAQPHSANLYLLVGNELNFVASGVSELTWASRLGSVATAVSPSGRYIAFTSAASLTGFDNTLQNCSRADCGATEIYRFDAQDKGLECVSCGSNRPTSDTGLAYPYRFSGKSGPSPASFPRQVLDDGRVFFVTEDSLVPQDVNGTQDVYEYEDGQPHLISTGTASGESSFFDADPSGANVFFATSQDLVPADADRGLSIYDARVSGGFPEPPPAPACEGEACRGAASAPPGAPTPGSATFSGREEGPKHPRTARCKRKFVKRHGRCVKKRPHKNRHRKNRKHHKKKRKGSRHASSKRRNAR